jgi:mono/diheme cytochrome c family protein
VALGLDPGAPSGGVAGLVNAVGQPFSLDFVNAPATPEHGFAFVAGLLTDNVTVFDSAGGFLKQWSVPKGSIPRQVLLNPSASRLYVYCWGSNAVRAYDWNSASTSQTALLRLGNDPTPADLIAGRALFFDAQHSRHGNLSCASCHVEGGSDLLVWNLSNRPVDNKGPMETQTLVGIERTGPFHWRGERDLSDFRGAFKGLLGKVDPITQLPMDLDAASFAELERYIFSLRNPANPNQSRWRQLDDTIQLANAPAGSATVGQNVFNDDAIFQNNTHTCANCHAMPLGTSHDITPVFVTSNRPRRAQEKAAAFHELWRKQMSAVTSNFGFVGGPILTTFLGTGFAHTGVVPGLFEFVDPITSANGADLTAFVHQWDQGLGQAAHYAYRLSGTATAEDVTELSGFLLAQARGRVGETLATTTGPRNCDIAVFGSVRDAGGVSARRRWAFDRYAYAGQGIFRCDDPTFTTTGQPAGERRIDDFLALAAQEDNVFLGVPVGMGPRFGIDYDTDGTVNAIDPDPYDPSIPLPSSGPSFLTADPAKLHDLLWTSTKSARIRFDTDQPTRFDIWVWPLGSAQPVAPTIVSSVFSTQHAALITGLAPSTKTASSGGEYPARTLVYNVVVRVTNRAQLTASTALSLTSASFLEPKVFTPATTSRHRRIELTHRIGTLSITPITATSGNPARRITVQTLLKRGSRFINGTLTAPRAENRVLVGRVFLRNGQTGVVSLAQVSPLNGTCFPVDAVFLNTLNPPKLSVGALPGGGGNVPFLVTETPTLPNNGSTPIPQVGTTKLEFEVLTPMGQSDKVLFCVDSVLHVDPQFNNWLGGAGVVVTSNGTRQIAVPSLISANDSFPAAAWGQWSFPDTKEARAEVQDP